MGAGKSTVAAILRSFGHPVYDADAAAKSLYERDPLLADGVRNRFGQDVFMQDGTLNRRLLAERAFSSDEALSDLNALVHPAVARDFECWRGDLSLSGVEWVFREAAILFESGSHRGCDSIWVVTAPMKLRVQRIQERDGLSEVEMERRLSHQWNQERLISLSDKRVVNDGTAPLVPRIAELLTELLSNGATGAD